MVYVLTLKKESARIKKYFLISCGFACLTFLPWGLIIIKTLKHVLKSNDFTSTKVSISDYMTMILMNLSRNFFDFGTWSVWDRPFVIDLTIVPILISAALSCFGIYALFSDSKHSSKRLLILIILCSFSFWFAADLTMGGKRAVVARYLMPCWVVIFIGLASVVSSWLRSKQWRSAIGLIVIGIVFIFGSFSISKFLVQKNWWTTRPPQMALDLESFKKLADLPVIIANYDSTFALLSVAFYFPENTKFILIDDATQISKTIFQERFLLFKSSKELQVGIESKYNLEKIGSGAYFISAQAKP